jgi:cell division protein FtsZ
LLNITGGNDLALFEVNEAAEIVIQAADPEANIIFGAVIDESLKDEVRVTVIATGFSGERGIRRPEVDAGREELEIKPFANDDLDIPAFLRRRT